MADLATLQARLAEAETAHHRLVIGDKQVTVTHDDMSVTYQAVSIDKLERYMATLRSQIKQMGGSLDALGTGRRRAINVTF